MNKNKWLIPALCAVVVVCMAVTVWAVFFRKEETVLAPDYAPQELEKNAEALPDDGSEKMESPKGGGSVSLTYATEVKIDLSDKKASLLFANPGKSNQDMVVQVVVQDTVLVQSGTLQPGNRVTALDLLPGAEKMLAPGGYEGKFVILYYAEDSGEKSIINSEIPVSITVAE